MIKMEVGRISFSKASLYKMCPTAYHNRYIDRIKVPDTPLLFFGTYLHTFLPRFWNKKTGKIYYRTPDSFAEAGIGYFYQWISGHLPRRQKGVRFENPWDVKRYEEWARKILRGFYMKNRFIQMPIETEKRYIFNWRGLEIEARMDRVDEHEINGKRQRVIIDYKLGKPHRDKLKVHHGNQLSIYSLAFEDRHGERVPVVWYSLSTGKLFPSQRNEKDYDMAYEFLIDFKEKVENDVFPEPHFDNPYCSYCEFSVVCAERYPDAWSRRKAEGEILIDTFDINNPKKSLIDTNPRSWVKELYGPDFLPDTVREVPIGPRRYAIFGKNLNEAERLFSLKTYSHWNSSITERNPDYLKIESKKRMPKGLRKRLQSGKFEVFEKIREMRVLEE